MNPITIELALRAVSIISERVAAALADGQQEIDVDDLFIERTADQALEEARRKRAANKK